MSKRPPESLAGTNLLIDIQRLVDGGPDGFADGFGGLTVPAAIPYLHVYRGCDQVVRAGIRACGRYRFWDRMEVVLRSSVVRPFQDHRQLVLALAPAMACETLYWFSGNGTNGVARKLETGIKDCEWIYRFWANPGRPRGGIVPPPPVLAPGSGARVASPRCPILRPSPLNVTRWAVPEQTPSPRPYSLPSSNLLAPSGAHEPGVHRSPRKMAPPIPIVSGHSSPPSIECPMITVLRGSCTTGPSDG